MTQTKRIVVISDLQVPYNHEGATNALIRFIKRINPDALACVGDEADLPMVSRWEDGYRGEYSPAIQSDLDTTRGLLGAFRKALGDNKPFTIVRSNHTDRLERYIERKAPAIASLRGLTYPELVGLKELKITWLDKMGEIAPGVLLAHGDEGSISQVSGMTGYKLMDATGKSVVCGHTHRQGLVWASKGFNGRLESRFALEVGHLMDMNKAHYLRPRGAANWQLGFGMLEVTGKHVTPYAVPMRPDGSFTWAGKIFS